MPGAPIQKENDMTNEELLATVAYIRARHRDRRFAMKIQQKLDRSLESYLRRNATDWHPDKSDAEREKANKEVKELLKRIRAGEPHEFARVVSITDKARAPADEWRKEHERAMEEAARKLPVFEWVKSVPGVAELGLATIIAEAAAVRPDGSVATLSDYSEPAKLWKRLGFAPFDGHAGSTWKRDSWRPRTLTAEEWKENPFSGERYSLIEQLAESLFKKQWIGAAKADNEGEGRPNGVYGEIYAKRRKHTAQHHPDWTKQHSFRDALRIMMKCFLKDLWSEWNAVYGTNTVIRTQPKKRSKQAA
jgi:hypothetical protein